MIIAFGRLFLYNWSIDEAYGDLIRSGVRPGFERVSRGSNQFAVAPSRSEEGAAILAIDPHLSWSGPSRFWEFRVHAGEWHGSGVTLPGSPYIGLGHNQHLAWAMTTGGPDTADIYELTLSEDTTQYLYEGEWRDLEVRQAEIAVRGQDPHVRPLYFSHHGPLITIKGNKGYAAATSYDEVANTNEAWYELNFADSYLGAVKAMETLTMFPQNVMVADTAGNIYYQRSGRVPKRPAGFDWSVPVDGSTKATEWLGIHDAKDHLQVLNPEQGYMQNCNIPPDAMMPDSPFQLDASTPYLFASRDHGQQRDHWTNQRGARAVELLEADSSVSVEEAMAYINDIRPYGVDRWLEALRMAHEAFGELAQSDNYEAAVEEVLAWNGELAAASTAALKYDLWRSQLVGTLGRDGISALNPRIDDWYAIIEQREEIPIELSEAQMKAMVKAFSIAVEQIVVQFGSVDADYGDRHRVGRGEESWPVGGGGGRTGVTTLRNIGFESQEDGTEWGTRGQTSTQVVVMSQPPRSWIYIPQGQSDRPDSPHYSDQAEKLFSKRQLKESWWLPEDLAGHIASRTVLER